MISLPSDIDLLTEKQARPNTFLTGFYQVSVRSEPVDFIDFSHGKNTVLTL